MSASSMISDGVNTSTCMGTQVLEENTQNICVDAIPFECVFKLEGNGKLEPKERRSKGLWTPKQVQAPLTYHAASVFTSYYRDNRQTS